MKIVIVGGVAGGLWGSPAGDPPKYLVATVVKCVNYGNVTSTTGNGHIGGVVGRLIAMPGTIDQCANFGDVTAVKALAGGIVGQVGRDKETTEGYSYSITNCYNAGTVTATEVNGGIVARGYAPVTIENCVNVGKVNATLAGGVRFGAIDGHTASTVKNCFYLEGCASNTNDATLAGTGNPTGATAKSAADLQSAAMAAALGDKWAYNTTDGLTLKFLETPTTPEVPDTPTEPEKPEEPDTPVVPTGDVTLLLAIVCVIATAGVVVATKKREDR